MLYVVKLQQWKTEISCNYSVKTIIHSNTILPDAVYSKTTTMEDGNKMQFLSENNHKEFIELEKPWRHKCLKGKKKLSY